MYIRSFGSEAESHLAADKSIWDESCSPGRRARVPHLIWVQAASALHGAAGDGRLDAAGEKCGRPRHAQMSSFKGAAGRRRALEKPSRLHGPEEKKRRGGGRGGGGGGEAEGGGVLMLHFITLYC